MTEIERLKESVANFAATIAEVPIGAACPDDYKSVEEKIKEARETLRRLNARLLMLKAKNVAQPRPESPEKDREAVFDTLQEVTSNHLINNRTVRLCLHGDAVHSILFEQEGSVETQRKLSAYMLQLFALNAAIISMQKSIEKALCKQLELKIQCQKALFEYRDFLKEQEKLQSNRLQKTNVVAVRNKKIMTTTIQKTNIVKRLITSLIATCGHMLKTDPMLLKMMEKHRDLITVETILEMSHDVSISPENEA